MSSSKKLAYALARVSTSEQSTQTQISKLKKEAEKFGFYIPDDCIFHENVSGYDDYNHDRQSIVDLKNKIDNAIPKPSAIFCWELSRLTRNSMKVSKYIQELSLAHNIPMYFLDYQIWTITNGVENRDGIQQLVGASVGVEKERENTRRRTSIGRLAKAEENQYVGHLSDGYIVEVKNGEKKIVIDNNRKEVIKRIFQLYLQGHSTNHIAALLNAEKVPTTNHYRTLHPEHFGYKSTYTPKGNPKKDRSKAEWDGSSIANILSNIWYKGERSYKGATVKLFHDAIISPDTWQEVASMLEAKEISHNRKPRKNLALLSGKIYCGKCGRKMYSHVTGLNNHYYCSSYDMGNPCGLRGVNKENIEAIIYELISKHAFNSLLRDNTDVFTNFFQTSMEEKKAIKENIKQNEQIIQDISEKVAKAKNTRKNLILQQAENLEDKEITQVYQNLIEEQTELLKKYEQDIIHYEATNRSLNKQLLQEDKFDNIIKRIQAKKDLDTINLFFDCVIQEVRVYNCDANCNVIRILYTNNKQDEFAYAARLMRSGFLPISTFSYLHYNENSNLIESDYYPLYVTDGGFLLTEEEPSIPYYTKIDAPFSVEFFVKSFRRGSCEQTYIRLENLSEKALEQQKHYREWRKKYNTGKPTREPWVLKDADYEKILQERKKLYNRKYKIKNHKSLSKEKKKILLEEIEQKLEILSAQVKYLPK